MYVITLSINDTPATKWVKFHDGSGTFLKTQLVWEFAFRVSRRRNSCDVTKYEKAKEVCVHAFSTPKRINFRVKLAEIPDQLILLLGSHHLGPNQLHKVP